MGQTTNGPVKPVPKAKTEAIVHDAPLDTKLFQMAFTNNGDGTHSMKVWNEKNEYVITGQLAIIR